MMKSSSDSNPLPSDPARDDALADAAARCRASADFLADLAKILDDAQAIGAAAGLTCLGGGGCCKFDLAGFRLYISAGEMAMLSTLAPPNRQNAAMGRCPYQVGARCMARDVRPLGCRMHFCRAKPSSPERQQLQDRYEKLHARIRRLHEIHDLPYAYADLIDWLRQP